MRTLACLAVVTLSTVAACGDDGASNNNGGAGGGQGANGQGADGQGGTGAVSAGGSGVGGIGFGGFGGGSGGGGPSYPMFAELWYSADQLVVLIQLDTADGTVENVISSTITTDIDAGQSALTMLDDGSLLIARLSEVDDQSHFYFIPDPPRDGSDITPVDLGVMPNGIMLEGLYTDCDGRLYGMDTGVDNTSSEGNRLLRFTGDVTAGDFSFDVVSDLATADVADIDDMSPAISGNEIIDNPGLAIDSGTIHNFNYETGSGTEVGTAGTWGIHALGADLFDDAKARLYVLTSEAVLYEINPVSFAPSAPLVTGPMVTDGVPGWSGLAGPLTDCTTGFTPPPN